METSLDNKFYVPNISEFYVGFEYESLQEKAAYSEMMPYTEEDKDNWEWKPVIFGTCIQDNEDLNFEFKYQVYNSFYTRVKYLDKSDIESLGFVQVFYKYQDNDNLGLYTGTKESKWLNEGCFYEIQLMHSNIYNNEDTVIGISSEVKITINNKEWKMEDWLYRPVLFKGTIKNLSELKVLLKQLDIE